MTALVKVCGRQPARQQAAAKCAPACPSPPCLLAKACGQLSVPALSLWAGGAGQSATLDSARPLSYVSMTAGRPMSWGLAGLHQCVLACRRAGSSMVASLTPALTHLLAAPAQQPATMHTAVLSSQQSSAWSRTDKAFGTMPTCKALATRSAQACQWHPSWAREAPGTSAAAAGSTCQAHARVAAQHQGASVVSPPLSA